MNARNARDGREAVNDKAFEVFTVAKDNFQQIVIFASNMMTLQHFGHLLHQLAELIHLFVLVHLHGNVDETQQVVASFLTIYNGGVLADVAILFEAFQA